MQNIQVQTSLPIVLPVTLAAASVNQTVDVEAAPDLVETDPHAHTDIDRSTIDRLPLEEPTSQLSSIVTEAFARRRG